MKGIVNNIAKSYSSGSFLFSTILSIIFKYNDKLRLVNDLTCGVNPYSIFNEFKSIFPSAKSLSKYSPNPYNLSEFSFALKLIIFTIVSKPVSLKTKT